MRATRTRGAGQQSGQTLDDELKRLDEALRKPAHAVRLDTNHAYWRKVSPGTTIRVPRSASTFAGLVFCKQGANRAKASTTLRGVDGHAHLYLYGRHLYRKARASDYQADVHLVSST